MGIPVNRFMAAFYEWLFVVVGPVAVGFGVFFLLEALLPGAHPPTAGAVLFRFQLSSMIAMGVFAGLAIHTYAKVFKPFVSRCSISLRVVRNSLNVTRYLSTAIPRYLNPLGCHIAK